MKCEKCNEKEASIFFEQTVNGESRSMHLCPECAAKVKKEGFFEESFPFGTSLFGSLFGLGMPQRSVPSAKKCEGCGAGFADIRREGKAACPRCYTTFARELEPTLRSLHGNVTHVGRAPALRKGVKQKAQRLEELRTALRSAIAAEEYEKAATLRDEIKSLEKEGV